MGASGCRPALASGTEFNRADATEQDLLQVLNAYSRFDDPFLRDRDLRAFLLRMAGQQMTWQVPEYETIARTAAVFAQTPPLRPMECLLPGWDTELFGCGLHEYVGTAQLVWASAIMCAGRFDPAVFDTPDGALIDQQIGRNVVTQALNTHFATDVAEFRREEQALASATGLDQHLRRFSYNPLRGHPLLTGFGPGYLCPVPYLALAKAAPWGVYFTGLSHFGEGFARDLGHLFEQYIGRQLRLLPGALVKPEITYGPPKAKRQTVDWIVVLPEVILLVEVKSAIPTEPVRLGTLDAAEVLLSKLGRACRQIDVTAQLITDGDPALAFVPAGRPILGLAVTLEPFHLANAGFDPLPATHTKIMVADASEVEDLVMIADMPPGQLLLERADDAVRSTWSLDTAFQGHTRIRNPVLDDGWNSYPWAAAAREFARGLL